MSSYYGVIFPEFWTGRTGRELRQRGGKDAQVLGLYLATNRHANMIGLYRLFLEDLRAETGLGVRAIAHGLAAVEATDFAHYDMGTCFTWVLHMARFRLGLKVGETLAPSDNKVVGVNKLYHAIDANPFLGAFFDAYHQVLHLKKRREPSGLVVPVTGVHQISPLLRGSQGAHKPGTGSGTGSGSGSGSTPYSPPSRRGTPQAAVRIRRRDREQAERILKLRFGHCPHDDPRCASTAECVARIAVEMATRRIEAERAALSEEGRTP